MNRLCPSHPCTNWFPTCITNINQMYGKGMYSLSFLGWYERWFESIYMRMDLYTCLGGGFKYVCNFNPYLGNDPIWLTLFKGLKPPTSHIFYIRYIYIPFKLQGLLHSHWIQLFCIESHLPTVFQWATRHSASTLVDLHKKFHSYWFHRQIKMISRDMPKPCNSGTKYINLFQRNMFLPSLITVN